MRNYMHKAFDAFDAGKAFKSASFSLYRLPNGAAEFRSYSTPLLTVHKDGTRDWHPESSDPRSRTTASQVHALKIRFK